MTLLASLLLGVLQSQVGGCKPDCTITAPRIESAMMIDGQLAESEWVLAQPTGGFQQFTPQEGSPATQGTEVRVLHDGRILYIGAKMHDSEPGRIRKTRGRRDVFNSADWFAVAIDTYGDGRTAFQFAANAAGVRVEGVRVDGVPSYAANNPFSLDTAWDAEWQAKAHVDSTGWILELAIPMSEIELQGKNSVQLGVNFSRFIARRAELSEWVLIPARNRQGGTVMHYGTLHLTGNVNPGMHRNAHLLLNAYRFRDVRDLDMPAVPIPGADASLAILPSIVLQAAVLPEVLPESFNEYLKLPIIEDENSYQLRRLFVAGQQQLSGPGLIGNVIFQHPLVTVDSEITLGALAAHGRLPIGLTYSAASFMSMPPENARRLNNGIQGRIRQNVGPLSTVGLLTAFGSHGSVSEDTTQVANIRTISHFALSADVVGLDWDLRAKDNALRITGQAAVSRERNMLLEQSIREVRGNVEIFIRDIRLRSPQSTEHGFAAQIQFEQLKKKWNLYGGFALADSRFRVGPFGRSGLTDRMMIYSGVNHSAAGVSDLLHSLHFTSELTQHLSLNGFGQVETAVSGYAAALTSAFNQILLSVRVSRLTEGQFQAAADIAGSTDVRRSWIFHPKAAISASKRDDLNWHVSATAIGRLTSIVSIDISAGLEGRSSNAAEMQMDLRSLRHMSSASLSGFQSMALSAYRSAWQSYPWVGFSLPALNQFGIPFTRTVPDRFAFARAGANLSILPRVDLELGAAMTASGDHGSTNRLRRVSGGASHLFLRLGWEYKSSSRLELGLLNFGAFDSEADQTWQNVADLFGKPFSFTKERLYLLRLIHKIWR